MELEQRVQMLEQEVQILKSQIQASLLEIQEMLLTQAHPSLHSADAAAVQARSASEADTLPAPPVRRVSINSDGEILLPTPAPASLPSLTPAPTPAVAKAAPDWKKMARLEKWASEKVQQVGTKKTREMIKLYAEQGRFDRHVRDQLMRFVAIYEEDVAPSSKHTPPVAQPPVVKRIAPPVPKPLAEHTEADNAQKLVLRLIAGVQNIGIQPMRRKNG